MNDLRLIFLPGVQCPRAVTGEWSGGHRSALCPLLPTTSNNITTSHLCCCLYFLLSRGIIAEPVWDNSSPSPDTDNFILLSALGKPVVFTKFFGPNYLVVEHKINNVTTYFTAIDQNRRCHTELVVGLRKRPLPSTRYPPVPFDLCLA